jgi:hypothetical protein
MAYVSSNDPKFLATLQNWLRNQPEILVLFRYSHAAGSKDFELFTKFEMLSARLCELPPRTCIIAFKKMQLPLRGVVDNEFIAQCLSSIPEGSEFLVLETIRKAYGCASWFHWAAGESHTELRQELEELRGSPVAIGQYPPWLDDSDDVISAVVPDEHGEVKAGVY